MLVQSDQVAQMMDDLFTAMLGMPFNAAPETSTLASPDLIQATVQVSGEWNAEIRVFAGAELVQQIACAMFAMDAADLTSAEMFDALGEVVNVIGGNVKGVVDRDCALSLPSVSKCDPTENTARNTTAAQALNLVFQCAGSPIGVEVLESACVGE